MATTYTTLTTLTEIVPKLHAKTMAILNLEAGILDTLRVMDTAGQPGVVHEFATYTPVTSSDVETPGENTATTNVIDLETNTHLATVSEHVITFRVSDLARDNTIENIMQDIPKLAASAIRRKLEDDIVNLFGSFSQTVCGAGTTLTEVHLFDAIRQIRAAEGDVNNLVCVLSPKQIWGAKGLVGMSVDMDLNSGNIGEDFKRLGFVGRVMGMDILVSNEINEDVASGGDAAGAVYQRGAIGLATKNIFEVELQRNAEARYTSIIFTGKWGEVEIYDGWGVYALSDVA